MFQQEQVDLGNTFTGGETWETDWTIPIGAMDYKSFDPRSLSLCDGTDPSDQNVSGEAGWRCQYQIGTQGEGPTAYSYPLFLSGVIIIIATLWEWNAQQAVK